MSGPDRERNQPEDRWVYLPVKVTYEGLYDDTNGPYFKGLVQMSPAQSPMTFSISESMITLSEEVAKSAYDWHRDEHHGSHTCPEEDWLACMVRAIRLEGWVPMGTHIDVKMPADRVLVFSDEEDDGGLPVWERIESVGKESK